MANLFKNIKENLFNSDEDDGEVDNASEYEDVKNENIKNMNAKMVIVEPRSFEEMQTIAGNLLKKRAVVVNIHRLQENHAQRLLDYLSGVVFAIRGSYQMIDKNVFLFTPNELPVDGGVDFENRDTAAL